MKRPLSILFSVNERTTILNSYINDSLLYTVAKRFTGCAVTTDFVFAQYRCFCIMQSKKRVHIHVRNSSTVQTQEHKLWTQVEKDINKGVLILWTVD